jgi:hypothetical protein
MAATCARFIAIQRQKHAAGTFQLPARSIKRSTKVDSFSGSQMTVFEARWSITAPLRVGGVVQNFSLII